MSNEPDKNKPGRHGHKGHLWMMAICCGLPIAGWLAIAVLGVSLPSLNTLILLLCPIGMAGMMYFMRRDGCAGDRQDEAKIPAPIDDEAEVDSSDSNAAPDKGKAARGKDWLEA